MQLSDISICHPTCKLNTHCCRKSFGTSFVSVFSWLSRRFNCSCALDIRYPMPLSSDILGRSLEKRGFLRIYSRTNSDRPMNPIISSPSSQFARIPRSSRSFWTKPHASVKAAMVRKSDANSLSGVRSSTLRDDRVTERLAPFCPLSPQSSCSLLARSSYL